ncbi:Uncharacterized protein PECH_006009 [Penicillium ucsense]|uniref:DH domain-containing protein n=1 Tax=Penicillium ucsense TaxID=2839758 RepID=A0A8J8W271_9EURO|nr:Uncharacterized protein PECM_006500 [Penicillium ucsense]KAF7735971.1 Uncharacterized protein PECH_006009 [Penicillium ucsense]
MEKTDFNANSILSHDFAKDNQEKVDTIVEGENHARTPESNVHQPFQKWMDSFHAHRRVRQDIPERDVTGWHDDDQPQSVSYHNRIEAIEPRRNSTSSGYSSQLGTAKTISVTATNLSGGSRRERAQSSAGLSSFSGNRYSVESSRPPSSHTADEAADERAKTRRRVLNELLRTEAEYVTGLKALAQVISCFELRPQLSRSVEAIRAVHARFLTHLQAIAPLSTMDTDASSIPAPKGLSGRLGSVKLTGFKRMRSRSLRTRTFDMKMIRRLKALQAEPLEALEIARAIDNLTLSFFVYRNFCENFEIFTRDLEVLQESLPDWPSLDQGLEALSRSATPLKYRKYDKNKSMTFNDLLMKPIQRLCKYSLLLQELLKQTWISDCPSSHDGIGQILVHLHSSVAEINALTGNPLTKDRIQKTMLLQQKTEPTGSSNLQDMYKDLGPLQMCGVLFVTYQTPGQTTGSFMVCALFHCYFLIARRVHDSKRLEVIACVYLLDLKEESVQNGQGLFCYECFYSWKFVFRADGSYYEFVFSASSATEEKVWQTEILKCSAAITEKGLVQAGWRPREFSVLNLPLVSLHQLRYQVSSLARRSSMDVATVARKTRVQDVVIKKTRLPYQADVVDPSPEGEIERPKTTVPPGAVVVVAKRAERIRLEALISDIYTREVLPFPGMGLSRSDQFRRRSIMRHLSIHAGFGRQSTSKEFPRLRESIGSDVEPVDDFSAEEKHLVPAMVDGADDLRCSADAACARPRTPTTDAERQRTIRFQDPPGSLSDLMSTEEAEQLNHGEPSTPVSPSRKKWFGSFSPRRLRRSRASVELDALTGS